MWLSGTALVLLFFFFPETSPDNILYRRAQRLRKATGDKNLRAQSEIDAAQTSAQERLVAALIIPITLNFYEPIVLVLNIYIGLIYALLYIWYALSLRWIQLVANRRLQVRELPHCVRRNLRLP